MKAREFVEKNFGGDLEHGLFLLTEFLKEMNMNFVEFPDFLVPDEIDAVEFQEYCDAHEEN